jgi:hypothetical protein
MKYVTDKKGREVEVVTRRRRPPVETAEANRPIFGGPKSIVGQRVQRDLDATVLGDLLHAAEARDGE